jgi:hypothetical protein
VRWGGGPWWDIIDAAEVKIGEGMNCGSPQLELNGIGDVIDM